jgi:hypothetical protein
MPMNPIVIAQVCHEANRGYCAAIGDATQVEWSAAEEWQRQSALRGVEAVLSDPTITPEALHEKWSADKLADGWKWGAVKDAEAKKHPCLVPYDELPIAQRAKDALFSAIVRSLSTV